MKPLNLRLYIIVATVHFGSAYAWEATVPAGDNQLEGLLANALLRMGSDESNEAEGFAAPGSGASPFEPRIVAYPYDEGVELGQGWDFVLNRKKHATCITYSTKRMGFGPEPDPLFGDGLALAQTGEEAGESEPVNTNIDKYQEATLRFRETIDIETLNIALNANFSGSAKGSYAGFTASAEAKNSFSSNFHYSTTDQILVAHASIKQGAAYVVPGAVVTTDESSSSNQQVGFTKSARTELSQNASADFRQRCGDGFVSSIVSGADLYLLFHFRHVEESSRIRIDFSAKASAGFGDVFGASGSSSLSGEIEKAISNKALEIHFAQLGGKVEELPVDILTARQRIAALPKSAWDAPRPLYMVVTPYSEIRGGIPFPDLEALTLRQRAIRYYQRLLGIYFEILNMREDYFRDRDRKWPGPESGVPLLDLYFYEYGHKQRHEDLGAIGDEVFAQIKSVRALLPVLESEPCISVDDGAAARCAAEIDRLGLPEIDFDDLKYWIKLPLPMNVIPPANRAAIRRDRNPSDLYAQYLFRFWIERQSQVRCRLFLECLSQEQREGYYNTIKASLAPI